jgi:ADP-heptose:LPS heptosyltransferase
MSISAPRFLILQRRYLGDLVLLTAVFHTLRRQFPDAHLVLLCDEGYGDLLRDHPEINEVWEIPVRPPYKFRRWLQLLSQLRSARFTHVIDYSRNERSAFLALWTGAPMRITYEFEEFPRPLCRLYSDAVQLSHEHYIHQPQVDHLLDFLRPLKISNPCRKISLGWKKKDGAVADALLERLGFPAGQRILMVHPGSRAASRRWPAESFAQVIDIVRDRTGVSALIVGAESELDLVRAVRDHVRGPVGAVDQALSIPQFAALLSRACLLLCHDSGPMHVAAAVGVPVVALFGTQSPEKWGPVGVPYSFLQAPQPCPGCFFPDKCEPLNSYANYCIRHISVEAVTERVLSHLA